MASPRSPLAAGARRSGGGIESEPRAVADSKTGGLQKSSAEKIQVGRSRFKRVTGRASFHTRILLISHGAFETPSPAVTPSWFAPRSAAGMRIQRDKSTFELRTFYARCSLELQHRASSHEASSCLCCQRLTRGCSSNNRRSDSRNIRLTTYQSGRAHESLLSRVWTIRFSLDRHELTRGCLD